MHIRVFVVTYKNDDLCKRLLDSFISSDKQDHHIEINVINNYPPACAWRREDKYGFVKVLDNNTRPHFSTGHLARDWNSALLLGFENLRAPACDITVCLQNDTLLNRDCWKNLVNLHGTFDFITAGAGDEFHSYTIEAVRKIGLWDERFCNIGYQEADYLLRAILALGDRASCNDFLHGRVWNAADLGNLRLIENCPTGGAREDTAHTLSRKYHEISLRHFLNKWNVNPERWNSNILSAQKGMSEEALYPYF